MFVSEQRHVAANSLEHSVSHGGAAFLCKEKKECMYSNKKKYWLPSATENRSSHLCSHKSGTLLLKTGSAFLCVRLKHEQNLHAKNLLQKIKSGYKGK